jgi:hypothetical protein
LGDSDLLAILRRHSLCVQHNCLVLGVHCKRTTMTIALPGLKPEAYSKHPAVLCLVAVLLHFEKRATSRPEDPDWAAHREAWQQGVHRINR